MSDLLGSRDDYGCSGFFSADLMNGLEKTHEKGIRYSMFSYLRYSPEVAFTIPSSDALIPEKVDKLKNR